MLLLTTLSLAATVDRTIVAALAPTIASALRLTDRQMGVVLGPAFAFPYAAASPLAGWSVDRWGARRVLVAAVALWSGGMLVSAGAGTLPPLLAGRALCGLGQSALIPVALATIARAVAPARVGRGIALFTGVGTMGRSAAFGVAGLLLGWFAARWAGQAWAAVLVALALLNAGLIAAALGVVGLSASRVPGTGAGGSDDDPWPALWRVVRASPWLVAGTVAAALGPVVIVQGFTAWVAAALVRAHHLPAARAAALIGLAALASPIGHLLGGWAMDRSPRARSAGGVQAALALLCVPAVIAFAESASLALALVAAAALLLLAGAGAVAGLARVQHLVPPAARGCANGTFLTITYVVGVGCAPLAVGVAAQAGLGAGGALIAIVTGTATIAAGAALATAMMTKRTSGREL